MNENRSSSDASSSSAKERLLRSIAALSGPAEVEKLIQDKLVSEAPLLHEIGSYLLSIGGKRMRPVLSLMTGKAFGLTPPSRELLEIAAGIELIHMATLLHDDIIDKSPVRRHKPSAFLKYGVDNTLLAGDFLLTRAFSLCAKLDGYIISETEHACIDLTEGEILEVPLFRAAHSIESYLTIARKKTASLFRLAAVAASHLAGAGEPAVQQMRAFGEHLGTAFQIIDDILDVTAKEDLLGKKSGMDLRERKPSIVNVLWLATGSALARQLQSPPAEDDEAFVREAIEELRRGQVIAQASELALRYAQQAHTALNEAVRLAPKADGAVIEDLKALLAYTTQRIE